MRHGGTMVIDDNAARCVPQPRDAAKPTAGPSKPRCQLSAHSAAISRAAFRAGRPTPIRVADAGPVQSP